MGKRRLDQIDERTSDAYVVAKLEHITPRGKKIEPQTINHHLKLLGQLLNVARKWKLLEEIPEVEQLEASESKFDFLDFEEADAFLACTAEHLPDWHPYMVVAVRTGLRVGEKIPARGDASDCTTGGRDVVASVPRRQLDE